jgi:beta-barrel assembly-enhancing protease
MKNILMLLLILQVACASKTSDRYREGNNAGQKSALTVQEEKDLTKEALTDMKKEFPSANNPALQAYITKLGQKLVAANKLNNNPYTYTFTVVDSPMVNAFALPAGSIFITTPIIAMAESEAEIAGVLGHEIGHVTARHTAERMYIAKKEQTKTMVFGAIGAAVLGTAGYMVSKKLCAPDDLECKAKLIGGGAIAGAAGGLFIQKYAFMKNSQEDELESDRVGFRYATNAGYDKEKVGDFYKKLLAMERESKKGQNAAMNWLSDAMASHPSSNQRVSQAEEMKKVIMTSGGLTSTPEFVRMKKMAHEMVEKHKTPKK